MLFSIFESIFPILWCFLFHLDGVDVPAAGYSFAPGREEGGIGVRVHLSNMDILYPKAAFLKNPLVCFPEIDMMASGHRTAIAGTLK